MGSSMLTVGVLLLCALPLSAQENNTYINHATRFAISPPLRDLANLPQTPRYGFHEANPFAAFRNARFGSVVDPVEQSSRPAPA